MIRSCSFRHVARLMTGAASRVGAGLCLASVPARVQAQQANAKQSLLARPAARRTHPTCCAWCPSAGARRGFQTALRSRPHRREVRDRRVARGHERHVGGRGRPAPCAGCTTPISSTWISRLTQIPWPRPREMASKPGVVYAEPDGRVFTMFRPERPAVPLPVEPPEDRHGADVGREPRREELHHRRGHRQRRGVTRTRASFAQAPDLEGRPVRQPVRLRVGR